MSDTLPHETPSSTAARVRPDAPDGISAEARAYLKAAGGFSSMSSSWPASEDLAGWEQRIAATDAAMHHFFELSMPAEGTFSYELREIGGTATWVLEPKDVESENTVFLDIHGGALILGAGELAWKSAAAAAAARPG
ncbi:hypothetical protein [Nocardioides alcanivorans]|uniref:hypothetical protein n=1 Tax=Nocardioides alcanivorans TaxID=2897352 RepID=UPI001F37AE9D|nr:hypothetical protein [Nocardioides alcanivorans]